MAEIQFRDENHWRKVGAAVKHGDIEFETPEQRQEVIGALTAYKTQLVEKEKQEFMSRIDYTPTGKVRPDEPARTIPGRVPTQIPARTQRGLDPFIMMGNAQAEGVDTETGLPASIRATANLLNLNEKAGVMAMDSLLRDHYKEQGVKVPEGVPLLAREDNTGKLAFLRPSEGGKLKPTLVNPEGLDAGDIVQGLDETVGMGIEGLAAATAGTWGLAQGGPVAAAGAAAAGAGAANWVTNKARKNLAVALGVPQKIADSISSDEELKEAGIALLGEAGGHAVFGAWRAAANRGRPLKDDTDVQAFLGEVTELMDAQKRVAKSTGENIVIDFSVAGGNPQLNVLNARGRRDLKNAESEAREVKEVEYKMGTKRALSALGRNIIDDAGPRMEVSSAQIGSKAQEAARAPLDKAQRNVAAKEQGLEDYLEASVPASQVDLYQAIQTDLRGAALVAEGKEDAAWGTFRKLTGWNKETQQSDIVLSNLGGATPIKKALRGLDAEANNALSIAYADSKEKLGADLGALGEQNVLDLNQLQIVMSHLKATRRRQADTNILEYDNVSIGNMVDAIQQQIDSAPIINRKGLKFRGEDGQFTDATGQVVGSTRTNLSKNNRTAVIEAYDQARQSTKERAGLYRENALHDIIDFDEAKGRFRMTPDKLAASLMKPGDATALREAMDVIGHNPVHKKALLEHLNSKYADAVLDGGKGSRRAHNTFMRQYEGHFRELVGKDEVEFIRNGNDLIKLEQRAKGRAARVEKLIKDLYGKKLGGPDKYSGQLVRDMLGDEIPVEGIARFKRSLNRTEDGQAMWRSIRDQGLGDIERRITDSGGNMGSLDGLNELLSGSNADRLRAMFGAEYVGGLKDVQRLMGAVTRGNLARAPGVQLNTPTLQMFRTIFGPLSTTQRRITAVNNWNARAANRRLAHIIANPEQLKDFIKLGATSPGTIAYATMAAKLGFRREELPEDTQMILTRLEDMKARK